MSAGAAAAPHRAAVSPPGSVAIAIGVGTTAGAFVRLANLPSEGGGAGKQVEIEKDAARHARQFTITAPLLSRPLREHFADARRERLFLSSVSSLHDGGGKDVARDMRW